MKSLEKILEKTRFESGVSAEHPKVFDDLLAQFKTLASIDAQLRRHQMMTNKLIHQFIERFVATVSDERSIIKEARKSSPSLLPCEADPRGC